MDRHRLRIRFRKEGDLRWISHRDLLRLFERMLRRAGLKLGMSEGFHPKPRMSFPLALALGIEGHDEVMELELSEPLEARFVETVLEPQCPSGLVLSKIEVLSDFRNKAQVNSVAYEIEVPSDRQEAVAGAVERFLSAGEILITRENRTSPIDLKADFESMELTDGRLRFSMRTTRTAGSRPREYLAELGLDDLETCGAFVTRTEVTLAPPKNMSVLPDREETA